MNVSLYTYREPQRDFKTIFAWAEEGPENPWSPLLLEEVDIYKKVLLTSP